MKKKFAIASATVLAMAGTAMGGTDFVVQNPDAVNGLFADRTGSSPDQRVADDFVNDALWNLETISFWGGYFPNNTPVVDDFVINFREDAGGSPGGIVHTTTLTNLVRTPTGVELFGVDEFRYDAEFSSPVNLPAGTFWVDLSNSTGFGSAASWFWETSSDGGNEAAWSPDGGITWNVQPNGLSMILGGSIVPAPGALALLGIAGLASRRRRRA